MKLSVIKIELCIVLQQFPALYRHFFNWPSTHYPHPSLLLWIWRWFQVPTIHTSVYPSSKSRWNYIIPASSYLRAALEDLESPASSFSVTPNKPFTSNNPFKLHEESCPRVSYTNQVEFHSTSSYNYYPSSSSNKHTSSRSLLSPKSKPTRLKGSLVIIQLYLLLARPFIP